MQWSWWCSIREGRFQEIRAQNICVCRTLLKRGWWPRWEGQALSSSHSLCNNARRGTLGPICPGHWCLWLLKGLGRGLAFTFVTLWLYSVSLGWLFVGFGMFDNHCPQSSVFVFPRDMYGEWEALPLSGQSFHKVLLFPPNSIFPTLSSSSVWPLKE